jgi:hypothetical protein
MLIATNSTPSIAKRYASSLKVESDRFVPSLTATPRIQGTSTDLNAVLVADGERAIAVIPPTVTITKVVINGTKLIRTNNPSPPVGYFYRNRAELTVNTGYNVNNLSVVYSVSSPPLGKLNILKSLPSFFSQYLIVGSFNFTKSFRGHPTGSVNLMCHSSQLPTIKNALPNGTALNLFNIGFRVSNLTSSEVLDNLGHIAITISLQGAWEKQGNTLRNPLDQPIREKDLVRNQSETAGYAYSYSAALGRVGVGLSGGNITKKVPRSLSDNQAITGRDLLEDQQRLIVKGYFVDWNSAAGPILKNWDSPSIFYLDPLIADLSKNGEFPSISPQEKGFGALFNGCQLSNELVNATLELDQDPDQGQPGDKRLCLVQGNRNPQEPPQEFKGTYYNAFDYNRLRSVSACFDNGQLVKKEIKRCQLNGSDLEVVERTYGFVFTSIDTYEVRTNNNNEVSYVFKSLADIELAIDWQLVREISYKFTYNKTTGYYEKKEGKGKELTRVLKETDEKEAIVLTSLIAEETDPDALADLEKQLDGYATFFWKSITGGETFELKDLSENYKDLRKPDESQEKYVAPLYAKSQITEENSLITRPDPRSTASDRKPDLILGEKNYSYTATEINSTSPEKYIQWNPVSNQGGTNLEESAASESFTENAGRPSTQNRLQETTGYHAPRDDEDGKRPKYKVSTPNTPVLLYDVETQTLNYPGAYTLADALNAVRVEYSILNSQNTCNFSIPLGEVPFSLNPGDIGIFRGEQLRVFNISFGGTFQPNGTILSNVSVELGKNMALSIGLKVS